MFEAVAEASETLPLLQLFCCFGKAPLLAEVERCIAADRRLRDRVHLLGKVAHARIELLMQGADLFVLGSHHEGSGCSLIEALACGLSPLVTDIPSYRALTGEGRVGKLWPCGQPAELCGRCCRWPLELRGLRANRCEPISIASCPSRPRADNGAPPMKT